MCGMQVSISGLLANEMDSTRWIDIDTLQFYISQTGLFSETISFWHLVVPLNNFASMSNCHCVQGNAKKPPSHLPRCVWGDSYSMILPHF